MLVLIRKAGEGLTITTPTGEEIEVFVVSIIGGRVKLSLGAPQGFDIVRDNAKVKTKKETK